MPVPALEIVLPKTATNVPFRWSLVGRLFNLIVERQKIARRPKLTQSTPKELQFPLSAVVSNVDFLR